MKNFRTDLTAFGALALVIAAGVILTVTGHDVPAWLEALGATLAAGGVGAAIPTSIPLPSTTPAGAGENELRFVGQGIPAPAAAPAVESAALPPVAPLVAQPAPVPAGRDMTETFPAITPAMIAADQAARA